MVNPSSVRWITLLPLILLASCLSDEPFKMTYEGYTPNAAGDGWEIATPEEVGIERPALDAAFRLLYQDSRFTMARSLIVVRKGKIVAEAYPHDRDDMYRIQNIQSCTKSFTSILTGIALDRGLLDSLDQTLFDIYPEEFDSEIPKRRITIRHLLTMRAGLEFNNSEHTLSLFREEGSSARYILSRPLLYEPGTLFQYNDGLPHLVSAAIQKKYGKPLDEFADEYLFTPLGIREWKWERAKDGTAIGAVSLFLKPRDAAKFGRLLQQNGRWDGGTIVDSSWIHAATQSHTTADRNGASYGYYFWIYAGYGGYAAMGHGGQAILVVPAKELVVVYTAWPYTSGDLFDNINEITDLIVAGAR